MKGRGRGLAIKGELRRPTDISPIVEVFSVVPKFDVNFETFSNDGEPGISPAEIIDINIAKLESEGALIQAAEDVCQFGMLGFKQAEIAVQVLKSCQKFTIGTSRFRNHFLKALQLNFSNRNVIEREMPQKGVILAILMCETTLILPTIASMVIASLECLETILIEGKEDELEIFYHKLKKLKSEGKFEEQIVLDKLEDLMMQVRKTIIKNPLTSKCKCFLLEILELHLRDWKPLTNTLADLVYTFTDDINK